MELSVQCIAMIIGAQTEEENARPFPIWHTWNSTNDCCPEYRKKLVSLANGCAGLACNCQPVVGHAIAEY